MTDQKMFEVRAEIRAKLTAQDIDDIMATAMDGGICYWCGAAEVVGGEYLGEYASDQISRGGSLMLYDAESPEKWELTLEKFLTGMKLYLENGGSTCVYDEVVDTCNIDADEADSIIQYALFGELVYG